MLPAQADFLAATDRQLLYSGAYGAGKTRALCLKLVLRALTPGAREGLCRKFRTSLRNTTLKTLLENDGDLPPVLPPGTYTHRTIEHSIRIHGGGEIVYFGLGNAEDYTRIGSLNLSGCAIDEAVELTEADWTMLRGRIRLRLSGLRNQLYGACNPGSPSHFLARMFGLAGGETPSAGCRAITTRSRDNRFLPDDYLDDLDRLVGVAHRRYVLGQWVGAEGLVYDRWDRTVHLAERDGPWERATIGVDIGYTNPTAVLLLLHDADGRVHVGACHYRTGMLEAAIVAAVQAVAESSPVAVDAVYIDPSAAAIRAALRSAGLPAMEADNAVADGIRAVQGRLEPAGDGRPRLTVDPSCVDVAREFESYEWGSSPSAIAREAPVKANDHALDALRYGVMAEDGRTVQPRIRRIAGDGDRDMDDERWWREA